MAWDWWRQEERARWQLTTHDRIRMRANSREAVGSIGFAAGGREGKRLPSGSASWVERPAVFRYLPLLRGETHVGVEFGRPAVAEKSGDGDLEDGGVNAPAIRGRCAWSSRPRLRWSMGRRGRSIVWGRQSRARKGRWGIARRRSSSSDRGRRGTLTSVALVTVQLLIDFTYRSGVLG